MLQALQILKNGKLSAPVAPAQSDSLKPIAATKEDILQSLAERTTINIDVAKCLYAIAAIIMAVAATHWH